MDQPTLAERMKAFAEHHRPLHEARLLKERAAELEAAVMEVPFNAARVVGAWARARRLWCQITGEPLI
jgi:hypothetical protein